MKIAHLSDPHFGTVPLGLDESLERALRHIQPDLIVMTGDITQRARADQFKAARRFMDRLQPFPLLAVPGNHDIPLFNIFARMFNPLGGFRRHLKMSPESRWMQDGIEMILINTTNRWRHIDGGIDLDYLKRKLEKAPQDAVVRVLAFHHPMDVAKIDDNKNLIHGCHSIANLCEQFQIDMVLGGHIHFPSIRLSRMRYPACRRNFIVSTAGTCLSHRVRAGAPNSFHLLDIDREPTATIKVTRHELNEQGEFVSLCSQSYRRLSDFNWEKVDV